VLAEGQARCTAPLVQCIDRSGGPHPHLLSLVAPLRALPVRVRSCGSVAGKVKRCSRKSWRQLSKLALLTVPRNALPLGRAVQAGQGRFPCKHHLPLCSAVVPVYFWCLAKIHPLHYIFPGSGMGNGLHFVGRDTWTWRHAAVLPAHSDMCLIYD
jgi:hypothetical protein